MNKKRSSREPRTEPRTEPTITPVWFEWEDKFPLAGADEVVEEGGIEVEVEIEVGTVEEVLGGDGRVRVEDRVGGIVEGSPDMEEDVTRVEGTADVEKGVAGVEDAGVKAGLVGEGDGAGEDSPPYTQIPSVPRGILNQGNVF